MARRRTFWVLLLLAYTFDTVARHVRGLADRADELERHADRLERRNQWQADRLVALRGEAEARGQVVDGSVTSPKITGGAVPKPPPPPEVAYGLGDA